MFGMIQVDRVFAKKRRIFGIFWYILWYILVGCNVHILIAVYTNYSNLTFNLLFYTHWNKDMIVSIAED